ncbi:MAG: undecaprenyl-diphosphate phosphatase [Pseudomonadota bacterium]
MDILSAIFLGIVEGLTEFLPVSSTGHLILFVDLLGFKGPPGHVFEVVIQLGAILAIVVLYWKVFISVLVHWRMREAQHFMRNILLAFVPAMAIGAVAHDTIKTALFNPWTVAMALVLGGVAILVIERVKPVPTIAATDQMDWKTALKIGFIQCIAMVPGVSRSGATIMGALMCGVERKAAAEFSFFLAVPTMLAATIYDLYKARNDLSSDGIGLIAIGFVVSFVVALLVVRWLVRFVQTHGFELFAYYRIALGVIILAVLAV